MQSGSRTLKDAVNEALRDWVTNVRTTYYVLGSVMGPHPYPMMVRDFHRVIGEEARAQSKKLIGRLPDLLVACVGGGSNAIGLFWPFIKDRGVRIVGVEPGGHGIASGKHGAAIGARRGRRPARQHELSAPERRRAGRRGALDLGGPRLSRASGPEHAYYKDVGRFEYVSVTDEEALEAFQTLTRLEGIMPALESAHAVAHAVRAAARMKKTEASWSGCRAAATRTCTRSATPCAPTNGHGARA